MSTTQPESTITPVRSIWLTLSMIIALLGVGASLYSLNHHLAVKASGHTDAACNINATFNCDEVALSKYSEFAGIPLGVFGLGYFLASLVLLGIAWSGGKSAKEHLHAYAAMVGIGVLTSIIMGGISFGVLGAYCVVCIIIYLLTLAQLGCLVAGRQEMIPPGFDLKGAVNGGTTAAIAVAVVIAAFNFLKPTKTPLSDAPEVATKEMQPLAPKTEDIPITKSAYAGLGEDYRIGGDNARVVIVEFADFQCPACQKASETVETLQREYGDKILVVFRNYPLDNSCNSAIQSKMHEFACKAAVMARCAGQYGKFWQYHDLAFGNQKDISEAKLKQWGKQLGLTDEQIGTCWTSTDLMAKIKDDIALGNKLGIDSTPTLYVNGRKVVGGRGLADLRATLDQAFN